VISTDRRVLAFHARIATLASAMAESGEINLEDQERLADQMRYEITSWLDFVRVQCAPSISQPALDLGDWRPHRCDTSRCCNRLEAR
jgi:hypothetical protein